MDNAKSPHEDGFFTQSMSDAAEDALFVEQVSQAWCNIFNAQGESEWCENWQPEQAKEKLFVTPAEDFDRSAITTWRTGGEIGAVAVIFVEQADKVMYVRELPPGRQSDKVLAAVKRNLIWVCGPDVKVAQYREFGIRPEFRGGFGPVGQLIADPARWAVERLGAEFGIFWTIKRGRLYGITAGLDVRVIYDFRDGNILMGEWLADALRRLSESPQQIAKMIGERRLHVKI